jgi:ATP-dependent DNA ligase
MRKRTASRLEFIPPLIPTLVDQPPEGEGWIHEVKFDGYRAQIIVQNGDARVYTRNGYDWSTKLWPIALAGQALPCKSAIIDGEVIVCNEKGASDFNAIGRAIKAEPSRLCYVAFDLLHLDGRDLRAKPLVERRAKLAELVRDKPGKIQFSESFEGDAAVIFRAIDAMGLEGMVSKRADSRYKSGPSKSWLKAKCFVEADLEVLGVVREPGEAPMALMAKADGSRKYVGARGDRPEPCDAGAAMGARRRDARPGAEGHTDQEAERPVDQTWPGWTREIPERPGRLAPCHSDRAA